MNAGSGALEGGKDPEDFDKILPLLEALPPPPDQGCSALGSIMELNLTRARPGQGRVEQDQRRIKPAERGQRYQRGKGVKDADCRFAPIFAVDGFENDVVIVNQGRNVVVPLGADVVPTVVPEVVDHQVEIARKQRPEWVIEIDREPAAVAQDDPGSRRIAVLAPARRLYLISLSLLEVANLVELYKRREVVEACDPLRYIPRN